MLLGHSLQRTYLHTIPTIIPRPRSSTSWAQFNQSHLNEQISMHFLPITGLLPLFFADPIPAAHTDQISLQEPHQASMSSSTPTIYFGYGSNLWLEQMSIRCPTAKYLGVARLNNYTWIINDRGYANVVEVNSTSDADSFNETDYTDVVFGLVYSLEEEDERRLDRNEGVPIAYTKELLQCDFWSAGTASAPLSHHKKINVSKPPTCTRDMLVYIDRNRTTPDEPRKEYIYRMNQGIRDASNLGVPQKYIDRVMRKFIKEGKGDEDGEIGEFARGQARQFRDESGVFR